MTFLVSRERTFVQKKNMNNKMHISESKMMPNSVCKQTCFLRVRLMNKITVKTASPQRPINQLIRFKCKSKGNRNSQYPNLPSLLLDCQVATLFMSLEREIVTCEIKCLGRNRCWPCGRLDVEMRLGLIFSAPQ